MAKTVKVCIEANAEALQEVLEAIGKKAREHNQYAKHWGGAGPNMTRQKEQRQAKAGNLEKIHAQIKEQLSP